MTTNPSDLVLTATHSESTKTQAIQGAPAFGFTATTDIYRFAALASPLAVRDQLDAKLAQLCAMLYGAKSDGGAVLRSANSDIREHYLWACEQMATECQELSRFI